MISKDVGDLIYSQWLYFGHARTESVNRVGKEISKTKHLEIVGFLLGS